jgi:transcriptional regulator with XRE-family HTH domain
MPRGHTPKRSQARNTPRAQKAIKRLGERLRSLREAAELTQLQAASAAELDPKHLQEIERGRTNPTLATLVALADAYKVSLSELFDTI